MKQEKGLGRRMSLSPPQKNLLCRLSLIVITVAISSAFLCFLALFDNQYRAPGKQAINGLLYIDQQEWESTPTRFLCDGWEFYPQQLLKPSDLNDPAMADEVRYLSTGQYGNFALGNTTAEGFGLGSYAMTLMLPETPHLYALEIPEIYSAYRFYLNDAEYLQVGNPDPGQYADATKNMFVTFWASGETTLLFSVSNYTFSYSGMVYPIAFGEPDAVAALREVRSNMAMTLCALMALLAVLALTFAVVSKSSRHEALLAVAVCVVGIPFISYMPLHNFLPLPVQPWHTIEVACVYCTLTLVVALHNRICGIGRRSSFCSVGIAATLCLFIVFASADSANLSQPVALSFSFLTAVFKVACAGYLLGASWVSASNSLHMTPVLVADIVFAVAIVGDRMVSTFQPIISGWFIEWGVVVLALVTGGVLVHRMAVGYLHNVTYGEERRAMTRQLAIQSEYLHRMEKFDEEERRLRHDFRQHTRTLSVLAHEGRYEELRAYADTADSLHQQQTVRKLTANVELNALLHYYRMLAKEHDIEFRTKLMLPHDLGVSSVDLGIVLGNLLENALDASKAASKNDASASEEKTEAPSVFVGGHLRKRHLVMVVDNTYSGTVIKRGDTFMSTKHQGAGVGIASSTETVQRLGGLISFSYDGALFQVQISIPLEEERPMVEEGDESFRGYNTAVL